MGKQQADNVRAEINAPNDAFGNYARAFRTYLEGQQYAPATLAEYEHCLGALGELMRERQIDPGSLNEGNVGRLITTLQRHSRRKSRKSLIAFVVRRFLRYLVESGVVMPPLAETDATVRGRLKKEYEDYLRIQRGLSERSIHNCWSFAERFLEFRFKGKDGDLAKITPLDIVRFMQHLISPGTAITRQHATDALAQLLPVLVQKWKDRPQSRSKRPPHRPAPAFDTAETLVAGTGGSSHRRREGGHTDRPPRLRYGSVAGAAGIARYGSHCDPAGRHRLARRRASHSRQGTIA
jgi:hypothetical protein